MSQTELERMLAEERAKLHGLNLKMSVNQLKNVREIRLTKKTIAQLHTALRALDRHADLS